MTKYEELRQRHISDLNSLLPQYIERVSWSESDLQTERNLRLRALIRTAKEKSPWHKKRLADVDENTISEEDLQKIPPMTKTDLMNNWDQIVTDRRLSLSLVEEHLEKKQANTYLLDTYNVVASGGSSGLRGVYIYDWTSWIMYSIMLRRWGIKQKKEADNTDDTPQVGANVSTVKPSHISYAIRRTFSPTGVPPNPFSIDQPLEE